MPARPTRNVIDLQDYRNGVRQRPDASVKVSQNTLSLRRLAAGISRAVLLSVVVVVNKGIQQLPSTIAPANAIDDYLEPANTLARETFENNNSTRISQTSSIFKSLLSEQGELAISNASIGTDADKVKIRGAFNTYFEMAKILENEKLLEDPEAQKELQRLASQFDEQMGQPGFNSGKSIVDLIKDTEQVNNLMPRLNNYYGIESPVIEVQVQGVNFSSNGGPSLAGN